MDFLELRHGELVWNTVWFDVEPLADIRVESFHFEAVPIEEPAAVGSLVEESTFPDSEPEFRAFFRCGFFRLLTDGNGIAFLVFAIRISDNSFERFDPFR